MTLPEPRSPAKSFTLDRGKLAVLTMFAIAFLAAGFAWWWNYQRGRQCLEFYGSEAALLIRTAPQVELLELRPPEESELGQVLSIAGQSCRVTRRIDISQAKGLIHARTSIVDDTSFEWNRQTNSQPQVRYAVRFARQDQAVTVAFDFDNRRFHVVERQRSATMIPKVAAGWQSFLKRQANSAP